MVIASDAFVVDGRYEVYEVLGRGGMGEVRRARDLRLQRDVAVKFLRSDLSANPDARERFTDEANHAAQLTHPNVVLVLDTGRHAGQPYLVMECLPGQTLLDEVHDGPLTPARATWIARDVLAALAAAHAIGIVHRDVSPSNILLTDTGRAKLADFGIAKALEGSTRVTGGVVLGTPGYLAPERLRGEPATPASDVYALGVTLQRALRGPSSLDGVLARMTDPDPVQRPSAVAARDALESDADIEPETVAVPIVAEPSPPTGTETVAIASAPVVTMASPLAPAPARVMWWRDTRAKVATAAVAVLLGLLLLVATDTDPHTTTSTTDQTTAPTTAVPPPTTVADPAAVARSDQGVTVERGDGAPTKAKGKGQGKRD